ncbi:MAG: TolC family protein, partial [Candidatus Solibacter usitatus]|nr:TolC family protein [Candidatus Solibacter usitatus]
MRTWLVLVQVGALYQAQGQTALSLKAAEAIAVKNNPRVSVALLNALAANQTPIEIRSAFYPAAYASVTVAGAIERSRIAAGGLNNPLILDRFASGVTISQLIADFGRTSHLAESASLRARAQEETAKATRAEVLLQVDRAYFNALRAQSVLEVARQTVATRQLVLEQVTALEKSKLRSGLDVSFAGVNLAEAKLLLLSAQNDMEAAFSELALAMGTPQAGKYTLAEENLPAEPAADVTALVDEALRGRPELKQFRLDAEGAKRFADAERDLWRPVISALAAAGATPFHETALAGRYAAAGINVSIPVFNGRLFSARRAEADLRARAAEQRA